jgi:hypothetical protein
MAEESPASVAIRKEMTRPFLVSTGTHQFHIHNFT